MTLATNPTLTTGDGLRPMPRRRHRSRWLLVGVLLAVLGAVAGVLAVGQLDRRAAAVAVARTVPYGQTVTAEDLRPAQLPPDTDLATIGWERVDEVVGQTAATDLLAGQLVTQDAVTSDRLPGPGQAVVGVAVEPGHRPALALVPRDHVLVVDTGDATGSGIDAMVLRAEQPGPAGAGVVDLLVTDTTAADVARLAAAGRAALVLLPTGG